MKMEHVGINVADARTAAVWYAEHLGLTVVHGTKEPVPGAFLADDSGDVLIELYTNPEDPPADHGSWHPLRLHLAFASDHVGRDAERLCAAGAIHVEGEADAEGYGIVMLRDPWGLAIQLCKRKPPFLKCQR